MSASPHSAADRIDLYIGDITKLDVDAIVNAANKRMLGGGGVDGAIHYAAGPELREACERVPEVRPHVRCPTGEARLTPGFRLPARHVVHTVGPVWHGGMKGEASLLSRAYRSSLEIAAEEGFETVAFPAISTGAYAFPPDDAARIAVRTVRAFLAEHDRPRRVLLVAYNKAQAQPIRKALAQA